MQTKIDELMDLPWQTEVHPEQAGTQTVIVATHPELFSCRGMGQTPQEALEDLAAARYDLLETLLLQGLPIPHPIFDLEASRQRARVASVIHPQPRDAERVSIASSPWAVLSNPRDLVPIAP